MYIQEHFPKLFVYKYVWKQSSRVAEMIQTTMRAVKTRQCPALSLQALHRGRSRAVVRGSDGAMVLNLGGADLQRSHNQSFSCRWITFTFRQWWKVFSLQFYVKYLKFWLRVDPWTLLHIYYFRLHQYSIWTLVQMKPNLTFLLLQ